MGSPILYVPCAGGVWVLGHRVYRRLLTYRPLIFVCPHSRPGRFNVGDLEERKGLFCRNYFDFDVAVLSKRL
jgi:hypothetical protein